MHTASYFGYLADHVSRKKMYGLEFIVIIFATIGQALASGPPSVRRYSNTRHPRFLSAFY
jgi:MFS family permease